MLKSISVALLFSIQLFIDFAYRNSTPGFLTSFFGDGTMKNRRFSFLEGIL